MTDTVFRVGHLERIPLGTPYPEIVTYVGRLLAYLPDAELIIDRTGVGAPVADMFAYAGISPIGVQITGGTSETHEGRVYGVPKLKLVSRLQALLHGERLKILKTLPEAEVLVRELQDFRVDYTATGNLTFNARVGRHDDLVLALAIAVWRACYGADGGLYEHEQHRRQFGAAPPARDFVGVDLGQSRDPTAIAVVRRFYDDSLPASGYRLGSAPQLVFGSL